MDINIFRDWIIAVHILIVCLFVGLSSNQNASEDLDFYVQSDEISDRTTTEEMFLIYEYVEQFCSVKAKICKTGVDWQCSCTNKLCEGTCKLETCKQYCEKGKYRVKCECADEEVYFWNEKTFICDPKEIDLKDFVYTKNESAAV